MVQTRLIRFFPLGTSFALLVLLVVACGDEATLTPSPSLAPTLSPTSTPEPISPEPTPTTVTPTPSPTSTSEPTPTPSPTSTPELIPTQVPSEEPEGATPPYPSSPVIEDITWHVDTHTTAAPGSDIWSATWGADGNLYTGWGDGGGFDGTNSDGRVSIGFGRIEGEPEEFVGVNVNGGKNSTHPASIEGGKPSAIISVDGTLYVWLNTQNDEPPDFQLAWSDDLGKTWQLSDWVFPKSGDFFPGKFLNAGKDNSAAQDEYIYSYGAKWIFTQGPENDIYLMRMPKEEIKDRDAYEFFTGLDEQGNPTWSPDVDQRQPVFTDPNGVGNTSQASVSYVPALDRYLLTVPHRPPSQSITAGAGQLGVFDAPHPWGPWTTVAYYDDWIGAGTGEALGYYFPGKWMSEDGLTLWMVFSCHSSPEGERCVDEYHDQFNLIKATITLK
jgi:Domain of unknown function (DUF4185)